MAELAARRPMQPGGLVGSGVMLARAVLVAAANHPGRRAHGQPDDRAAEQAVAFSRQCPVLAATLVVANTHDARVATVLEAAVSGNNGHQPRKY